MTPDRQDAILLLLQNIKTDQDDFRDEVREAFAKMNGRVRKTENSLLRWKTAIAVVGGIGTLVGFLIANGDKLQPWLILLFR